MTAQGYYINSYCRISNNTVSVNGNTVLKAEDLSFADFMKESYRSLGISYLKFFRMDSLSKLAFIGAELLLPAADVPAEAEGYALLFANSSASLDTDLKHQQSISEKDDWYPGPAVFVYTLPNICLGEISIRHQLHTENSFFIFDALNAEFFASYATHAIASGKAEKVLCGWVELLEDKYEAFLYTVETTGTLAHTPENINTLYQQ